MIFPNTDGNVSLIHRGVAITVAIVAKTARGFIVQFSSGAEIEIYEDEIKFD